ncbi:hypothetical protein [Sphaerimonospora mesophila]|uniref:hypothetical protein n=1 Tax=Sphaerimonospora mesophila TaxID=37483 RepID=UPI0006E23CBD
MSEPLTDEQLAALRAQAPVGFFCDHSDEPHTASSHHEWVWVDGQGLVFQQQPDVSKALTWPQNYLGPERAAQRCSRAVPVYAVDMPRLLGEVDRLRVAGKHLGGALDALGEVIRSAVRLAADTGDPAAGLREIASCAQQAGALDDQEPAGSPS